ncbi:kinesin motor domain-containing protein [Pilobolus umbonatus]|nr:kinesin motor domain-containing protein [Pilobolus umbonatus]
MTLRLIINAILTSINNTNVAVQVICDDLLYCAGLFIAIWYAEYWKTDHKGQVMDENPTDKTKEPNKVEDEERQHTDTLFLPIFTMSYSRKDINRLTISTKKPTKTSRYARYDPEKEPLKAYLRIRYQPITEEPYLQVIDDCEVEMTPPEDAHVTRHRYKSSYRFTKIFQNPVDQPTFFDETTKDLVKDVLDGYNALIFAYGVTNSGKTYTIMGKEQEEGILPRTLNAIFNSIQGHESRAMIKPVMHSLLEPYINADDENRQILDLDKEDKMMYDITEDRVLDVDPNYEYGIWVSYIEVYNEQIYDLLDPATTTSHTKRRQLQLKYEHKSGHKYVSNANRIRVKSVQEAYSVLRFGQKNKQVFSTLMNQTSSRSHSIFTVHVIRSAVNKENEMNENWATLSKLSIIDLAGSERYRNTSSTGQRLKEAGNINKSLMVLGQCMETLRSNQLRVDQGKTPAIVPFRHSKLTELFKSTFEGDGKAVIIVNVNPYDTGFDENNHVMKFSAVARDVTVRNQIQPKLDLSASPAKRARHHTDVSAMGMHDGYYLERDGSVENMLSQLNRIKEKWINTRDKMNYIEMDIRQQVTTEMENEIKKYSDLYMEALKREHDLRDIQLKYIGELDIKAGTDMADKSSLLNNLHDNQKKVLDELMGVKNKLDEFERLKQSWPRKMAELDAKHMNYSRQILAEIQDTKMSESLDDCSLGGKGHDSDGDTTPGVNEEEYSRFLNLRKRLRRSIFKKEELCEDADAIMKQVEQFDGVTFQLAKETKMGKLLKLIAQEEFEKDPYEIRNRAIKLFKRYAQLVNHQNISSTLSPNLSDNLDSSISNPSDFTHMTPDIQECSEQMKLENRKLKYQIMSLMDDKQRLEDAIEGLVEYIKEQDEAENVPVDSIEKERESSMSVTYDLSNPPSVIDDEDRSCESVDMPKSSTKKRR